jgi:hypothetical protein
MSWLVGPDRVLGVAADGSSETVARVIDLRLVDAFQLLELAEVIAGVGEGMSCSLSENFRGDRRQPGLLISATIFTPVGWSIARINFGSIAAIDPRFGFFSGIEAPSLSPRGSTNDRGL